jgi:2-hydroxychromene-2-carboxylate isomerase
MAAARTAGVFGSPNIVVGSELFSGDDRLEEAMGHASISSVAALDT